MPLLDIIKAKLAADGVADGAVWRVFIGFAPDTQDQLISLHLTGGFPQDTLGGETIRGTFQLRVRGAYRDYVTCEAKWRECFNALNDADLSADGICLIQALAGEPLEYDDAKSRLNMTMNFNVKRTTPAP